MIFAALLLPIAAQAEVMVGESLDWLTVDSDLVARGRVVRVSPTEVALADVVALRGTVGTTGLAVAPCEPVDLDVGEAVVVFLRADAKGWVPRCVTSRSTEWVISLDQPRQAYAIDGRAITTGAGVVSHLLAAALRPVSTPPHPAPSRDERFQLQQGPMLVEVHGPGAGNDLYAGSAVYLAIPPYADLLDGILADSRSPRPDVRERAARQLANYPTPEAEQRLRELLADGYVAEWLDGSGNVVARSWQVREAAWGALLAHAADLSGLDEPRREEP